MSDITVTTLTKTSKKLPYDEVAEMNQLSKELGLSSKMKDEFVDTLVDNSHDVIDFNNSNTGNKLHPIFALGIGTAALINIGILLSLPPVLRGRGTCNTTSCERWVRLSYCFFFSSLKEYLCNFFWIFSLSQGAPYLPTFEKNICAMFQQLRNEPKFMNNHKIVMNQRQQPHTVVFPIHAGVTATAAAATTTTQKLQNDIVFVDLGSGDGRVVFRAAQEQLFTVCIGYEINPLLHLYALMQRLIRTMIRRQTITATTAATTNYNSDTETQFYLRDLWNVNLSNANVVAVVRFFSVV
jgi:hypothetical protein